MTAEQVNKLIGKTGDSVIMEVEKGAIRKYADAVEDHNPIYWDEEYARNSRYGSITAPPGFFGWPTKWTKSRPTFTKIREEMVDTLAQAGYSRLVDAGIEYDFFHPVRAGDTLTALPRIMSISERESKGGKLLLSIVETAYTNQNGELVAKARQTLIHR